MEQSRPDDLWSMVYMLAEFRASLPWAHQQDKRKIAQIKANTLDTRLFIRSASEFLLITKHLRSLTYFTRPDYLYIFDILHVSS
jgi:hypothetical protein